MVKYLQPYYDKKAETDARIARDTEANRKSDAVLRIVDADGKPVRAQVKINQKSSAFKFGCNLFMLDQFPDEEHNKAYRELFPELFNYAVVPFYWGDYEVENGKPRIGVDAPNVYRRPAPDLVLEYTEKHGITTKGHCLMWHKFLPDWLSDDREQNMRYIQRRIAQIAKHYGSRIQDYDVVNETLSRVAYAEDVQVPANTYNPNYFKEVQRATRSEAILPYDCTNRTFAYADQTMPENRLFINETTRATWRTFNRENSAYYLQIESLLSKGRRIDGIGLQYHVMQRPDVVQEFCHQYFDPTRQFELLDQYSRFNRPLHISEVTLPAFADQPNSLEDQAEMTEYVYRLWFSHAAVESIVWWNFVDGTAAYAPLGSEMGENYYHGGLLSYNMERKPVYKMLDRLINHEWRTNLEENVCGEYHFRGFHGGYEVEITTEKGEVIRKEFPLDKKACNEWKIVC